MDYEQRISKTDLARSPHRAIREAQRGYTVLVENPQGDWHFLLGS